MFKKQYKKSNITFDQIKSKLINNNHLDMVQLQSKLKEVGNIIYIKSVECRFKISKQVLAQLQIKVGWVNRTCSLSF